LPGEAFNKRGAAIVEGVTFREVQGNLKARKCWAGFGKCRGGAPKGVRPASLNAQSRGGDQLRAGRNVGSLIA
jgi:hypothetical protein